MTTTAPPPALTPPKALPAPRFTGSTGLALVQAVGGLLMAVALLREDPAGYSPLVYEGPRDVMDALPGSPWTAWGVVFLLPSVAVLAMAGRPVSRYALGALAVAWAGFAVPALRIGLAAGGASCIGGLGLLQVAILVWLTALALGRRATPRR